MAQSFTLIYRALAGGALSAAAAATASGLFGNAWVGLGAGLAVAAILAFALFASYSRALGELVLALEQAAGGDLRATPPVQGADGDLPRAGTALVGLVGQLKLSKGNLKGLMEGIMNPYALVDLAGQLTYTNQRAMHLLERDGNPADWIGKSFSEFFYSDPTRRTLIHQAMEENTSHLREVEFKSHKGNTRFIQASLSPLHDIDGKVSGGLCLYLDLTDVKNKEARILEQDRKLMDAVNAVEEVVGALAGASKELSSHVDNASRGAQRQNERALETAQAMDRMNDTVREVAKNASQAADQAAQAKAKAQEGSKVVGEAVDAIHEVESLTTTLKGSMADLSTKAQAIGRIMTVISDIADQTNLLALNAAIEAARAGDAGRGFAVVADEVRKLAEKTMTATKEVGQATQDILSGVDESIERTDQAAQAVELATVKARGSGSVLGEIVNLVAGTSEQVLEIASSAGRQSKDSDQIAKAVEDVRKVSGETATEMTKAAGSVQRLATLAHSLESSLGNLGA